MVPSLVLCFILQVMVSEDSSHAYNVVVDNTRAYAQFVTLGSYLLVQDTKMTR